MFILSAVYYPHMIGEHKSSKLNYRKLVDIKVFQKVLELCRNGFINILVRPSKKWHAKLNVSKDINCMFLTAT